MQLAASPWPRTGVDRGNRGRVPVEGPRRGAARLLSRLPYDPAWRGRSGVAVAADGALRVVHGGYLHGFEADGAHQWLILLAGLDCQGATVAQWQVPVRSAVDAQGRRPRVDAFAIVGERRAVVVTGDHCLWELT